MIRIEKLRVLLGDREVLREVNFQVARGETVALMGASGSGKSTLLRAAAGLVGPVAGQVWLGEAALVGASPAQVRAARRKVGMLFQGNALFDSMTVAENIGFFLKEVKECPEEEIDQRVDDLLSRLHLGRIGKLTPAELSGGMKKRVGIARAVAHDPEIVFYDDPTAGLDPVTSEVIADLLAELAREKPRAAIVATNYLPLILKVASRAALLLDGKLLELGPTAGMLERGQSELREFLETGR